MSGAALLRAELSKEIRALLPLWAACVAALAAAGVWREGLLLEAAIVAYIVGPLALGAHSIGQEFTHRTLPILLSQPADRRRVYLLKVSVVALMALTLAALASTVLMDDAVAQGMWRHLTVQVLPIVGGLFVAPWLTMICRSALAGMLLTGSIASLSFLATMAIVALWLGIDADSAQAAIIGPWAQGLIAFGAVAGLLGLRRFSGLEAIDSASPMLHLPRWLRRTQGVRVHRPLRMLAVKELHLQQLTFGVAALFITASVTLSLLQRVVPFWSDFPSGAVTLLYCLSLPILIGALASAEERQLGTLEWQVLQPTPASQQWIVKVGIGFGLALLLGVGLAVVLLQVTPAHNRVIEMSGDLAVLVLLLTAGSLYLSSLSSSGVRAMVLSLPAGIGVSLLMRAFSRSVEWASVKLGGHTTVGIVLGAVVPSSADPTSVVRFLAYALAVGLIPMLLWFGFVNHTSQERPRRRILQQAASIALAVMMAMTLVAVVVASAAR